MSELSVDQGRTASASGTDARSVEVGPIGPKPGAVSGSPVESETVLFDDGRIEVGVWECTPGAFRSRRDGITEVAVVVAGDGRLLSDAGAPQELGDGVVVVTPDGWTGRWEIRSTLRKVYVVVKDPAPARTAAPADG